MERDAIGGEGDRAAEGARRRRTVEEAGRPPGPGDRADVPVWLGDRSSAVWRFAAQAEDARPQPTPDGTHELTCSGFAGQAELEACYDGEDRLTRGRSGDAVTRVQQALNNLHYPLPRFGIDGRYGGETVAAVRQYKRDRHISPADGVVGPKTMAALDAECPVIGGGTGGGETTPPQPVDPSKEPPKQEPPKTPPGEDPNRCKVDVRATNAMGLPFWHLFIIHTNSKGVDRIYRGGPGQDCRPTSILQPWGIYGGVDTYYGPYDGPDTAPDWDPAAPTKTVLAGPDACGTGECLAGEVNRIQSTCVQYAPVGPNSNTVVKTLLSKCGLPREKPVGYVQGWDDKDL